MLVNHIEFIRRESGALVTAWRGWSVAEPTPNELVKGHDDADGKEKDHEGELKRESPAMRDACEPEQPHGYADRDQVPGDHRHSEKHEPYSLAEPLPHASIVFQALVDRRASAVNVPQSWRSSADPEVTPPSVSEGVVALRDRYRSNMSAIGQKKRWWRYAARVAHYAYIALASVMIVAVVENVWIVASGIALLVLVAATDSQP